MRLFMLALGVLAAIAAVSPTRVASQPISAASQGIATGGPSGQAKLQPGVIQAGWHKHVPPGAGYQIGLPTAPQVHEMKQETDEGVVKVRLAIIPVAEKSLGFAVLDSEFPERLDLEYAEDVLDNMEQSFVASPGITLRSSKSITINGQPGRELLVDAEGPQGKGTARVRMLVTAERAIILLVNVPEGVEQSQDVDRFFNSFQLVKGE